MILESGVTLDMEFEEALPVVKAALAEQGFGTLTEIDVQATLDAKIGKEIEPYVIIGACNPNLAARALDVQRRIGALLPCNVVVRKVDHGVLVEAMDPALMSQVTGEDDIAPIAAEAEALIRNAMEKLAAS
jgi:uncharacterized protein (DUF302 family)